MVARLVVDFVVLLAAFCPTPDSDSNVVRRDSRDLRQPRHRFAPAPAHGIQLDLRRRGVLLDVQPTRLRLDRLIAIDREGVLGHVRVVQPITAHALLVRPAPQALQVLAQAVAEHACARGVAELARSLGERAGLSLTLRRDLQSQQAAFDGAVPQRMRSVGADSQLHAQLRGADENRGLPTLESLAQNDPQLPVEHTSAFVIVEAHAVGGVHAEQAEGRRRLRTIGWNGWRFSM